jgi:hypothetical protein
LAVFIARQVLACLHCNQQDMAAAKTNISTHSHPTGQKTMLSNVSELGNVAEKLRYLQLQLQHKTLDILTALQAG